MTKDSGHHLFYSDTFINGINNSHAEASGNIGDIITLDECESAHAMNVLRINADQQIRITDGSGNIYICRCADIRKRSVSCEIIGKRHIPKIAPELTLLIGLPDKDRFETALEHATALGVSRIAPITAEHCRKLWWESWEKQRQRFLSKMIVSMKQCLYPYLPRLDAPVSLKNAINECENMLFVADQNGKNISDAEILPHKIISCLVGPPGGLSIGETRLLETHTAGPVTMVRIASTRLRSELAATVLCSRIVGAHLYCRTNSSD